MLEEGLFSKGLHGRVRRLSDVEQEMFPEADLVREEGGCSDPCWFNRVYYWMKIANLVQPGCLIDVVAARKILERPSRKEVQGRTLYTHPPEYINLLYSRKAEVPEEHAIFSMHKRYYGRCSCDVCTHHAHFHEKNNLEAAALQLHEHVRAKGFSLPWHDPTDYCLHQRGNSIVFFEIETLNPEKVARSVHNMLLSRDVVRQVKNLLERASLSHAQSLHFQQEIRSNIITACG